MAFCINCGQELAAEAKFCANCGKVVNSNSTTQRKTVYDGELHKCPNCGELLNSFATNCPTCGYELRSVKTSSPVNELAKKIERASSVEEKNDLITNFYVPNTKEDIYDFFILAVSNLEDTNYDTDDAWKAKLEQTYHKAKISFGKAPEFEYVDELYKKTIEKVSKRGIINFVRKNKKLCLSALLVFLGVTMLTVSIVLGEKGISNGEGMLSILGLFCLLGPAYVYFIAEENEKEKKNKGANGNKSKTLQETDTETDCD